MHLYKSYIIQFGLYVAVIHKAHASVEKLHEARTSAVLYTPSYAGVLHDRRRVPVHSNS